MADRKQAFGTASQGITITLASLATGSARGSVAIDNTTNLFLDAMVYLEIPILTGATSSDKAIYVYAYASEDGTNYDDNSLGTDVAITMRAPTNLRYLDTIATPDNLAAAASWKKVIPSVARAFGGILPPKWGIVVKNMTGLAFNATEANIKKEYRGIYETVV